jgi:hypothetical protein
MRRTALTAALLLAGCLGASPLGAQGLPPHAWLFGAWTGGLYPAPTQPSPQQCLAHPVLIFTQDVVLRATLTDVQFVQRVIATARATPHGVDFAFAPGVAAPEGGLLAAAPTPATGFGCASPDVLHVERHGANEITLPGCADFPNPLVRCPG